MTVCVFFHIYYSGNMEGKPIIGVVEYLFHYVRTRKLNL